ncbi:hypothetical protein PIROE2DRAFT_60345 [Piromyces sp. E2]|nr:hypothetical protein PIROE2DRAFT_60345 [Piromyces sp. E2]|eukprot:OUM64933.1 hypothetical protein PIROE2DRAFT_60345 [Piromyces sp. E2]
MVYDLMRRHFNFNIWPGILYDNVDCSNDSLNNNFSNLSIDHIDNTNSTSTETLSSKKHPKKHPTKKGNKNEKSNLKKSREADINGSTDCDLNIKGLSEENSKLIKKMEAALKAHEIKLAAAFARIRIERKANGDNLTEQLENILPQEVRNKENSASEMPKYFRINTLKQTREQDKASCLGPHHIFDIIPEDMDIIDTVAGNGTRTSHLAALFKNTRKIYVFEKSLAKAEELKTKFISQGVKNVEILCTDFLLTDPNDENFSNVGAIICEPRSIGNAIVDKLGYMMQESVPSTKSVTFISRTVAKEDNETIISHILDADNNIEKFELKCVLPNFYNETNYDYEFSECLKLRPNKFRNGIYIACLTPSRAMSKSEKEMLNNDDEMEEHNEKITKNSLTLEQNMNIKKKKKLKKKVNNNTKNANASTKNINNNNNNNRISKSTPNLRERRRNILESSVDDIKSKSEKLTKSEGDISKLQSTNTLRHKKVNKSKKKLTESKNTINSTQENDDSLGTLVDMAGNGGNLNKPGAEKIDMDNLWIYGYSISNLQRFYAPQHDAMKQLNKKEIFSHKYPIPNPNPWK